VCYLEGRGILVVLAVEASVLIPTSWNFLKRVADLEIL